MIKINLLSQKKRASVSVSEAKGNTTILIGMGILLAMAAGVYVLVHMPAQNAIAELQAGNKKLEAKKKTLKDQTKDFDEVKKALDAAKALEASIGKLDAARATPAFMLNELSTILTKDKRPTMTTEVAKQVASDPNRRFMTSWDPKHVWIESIEEKQGVLTLHGGSATAADATQFAQRLQASVFFADVTPQQIVDAADANKVHFYKFTITGKVLY